MTEIAAAYPHKAVSVREISNRQKISPKYLEHIVRELKTAGLIMSVRGAGGGYSCRDVVKHLFPPSFHYGVASSRAVFPLRLCLSA